MPSAPRRGLEELTEGLCLVDNLNARLHISETLWHMNENTVEPMPDKLDALDDSNMHFCDHSEAENSGMNSDAFLSLTCSLHFIEPTATTVSFCLQMSSTEEKK